MLGILLICVVLIGGYCANVPLTLLDSARYGETARCLDGSMGGYYAQPASAKENSTKWVIYLNGGGECDSEDACKYQTTSALGSSKYFKNETDASGWFLGSDYCYNNPDFCTWNHVFDPYCSQDLHMGQRTSASDDTWGLFFSGHGILEATLNELDAHYGLLDATEIILSGASAGGIGVWPNVDWIAERYPSARVSAVTIAGFYFFASYYKGPHATDPGGMADLRKEALVSTYALYDAFVDKDCKEAKLLAGESPSECMLSNNSLPYTHAPAFVVQSETDEVVLTGHDCWPSDFMDRPIPSRFMKEWHANMTLALSPLMNELAPPADEPYKFGVFAAACYIHTSFSKQQPVVQGVTYMEAISRWYYQDVNGMKADTFKLADDCGEMCNPTCPPP